MKAAAFIAVASIIVNTVKAVEPKQLNLALETVLQFDKKDRAADLAVLDKVQDFLDQIKNAMRTSGRRSSGNDMTFTDFLLDAAKILKGLKDDDLEEAYIVINDESRRYINTENALRELFNNNDMRRYVSEKLDDNKEVAADDLRKHIDGVIALIEHKRETGERSDLLEIGNTLYDGASAKLRKALSDLENLRRGNEYNIGSMLRNALRSLAVLHYVSLNDNVKTQLTNMVQHYWRTFTESIGLNDSIDSHTSKRWKTRKHRLVTAQTKRTHLSNFLTNQKKKLEVFVSNYDLKKLIGLDKEKKKSEEQSNPNPLYSMLYPWSVKTKPHGSHNQRTGRWRHSNKGKQKKSPRTSKHESTESESESAEIEEKVLMGGQKTRDLHFRAEITSKEFSKDGEEDEISTEEIVIQHSNVIDVGLSRKTPGRLNITFVSPENSRISDEARAIRKSNVNDTFIVHTSPGKSDDVDKMIKHIEEQIEAVKDQVEYVKSLTHKHSENTDVAMSSNRTENITDAEALEANRSFSFRAQNDSDSSNSSEIEANNNNTYENVTQSIFPDATDTTVANKEKEIAYEENTSENSKNNTVNISTSIKGESTQVGDSHNINEDNHRRDETSVSPIEKYKAEDRENNIEVNNSNSTAANVVDAGNSAETAEIKHV